MVAQVLRGLIRSHALEIHLAVITEIDLSYGVAAEQDLADPNGEVGIHQAILIGAVEIHAVAGGSGQPQCMTCLMEDGSLYWVQSVIEVTLEEDVSEPVDRRPPTPNTLHPLSDDELMEKIELGGRLLPASPGLARR